MLKANKLTKKFIKLEKNKKEEFYADKNITFEANDGEIIGILGPNGAGKTTLLRMLAGILEPNSGTIEFDGLNYKNNEIEIKKNIAYLSGNTKLYDTLSTYELLKMCGEIYDMKEDVIEKKIKEIIVSRTQTDKKIVNQSQAYSKLGKVIKPVDGNIVVRFNQKKQQEVTSNGIEIQARMGAKIKSSAKGKVIYADVFQGLGKVVMIDYGYNMIGVYGNLIATKVKLNQQIQQGAEIGILGLSVEGKPNLYYELRFNLKPIDPVPMFK